MHTSDERSRREALLQHSPNYLYVVSRAGMVCYANKQPAIVGTRVTDHVGVEPALVDAALERVLRTGHGEEHVFQADKGGATCWYRARMERCAEASEAEVLLYVTDITEQRQTEQALLGTVRELEDSRRQMAHAHKMQSLGRLAGGVAHDFNNLLTAIISFTRFVMDDMGSHDPRRADLVEVLKAADSASKLTRQLLAFSRNQTVEPVLTDLNSAITRFGRVLQRTLEEPIHLRVVENARAVQVMCDPGQLDQLIMNLAVNARDAMPEGGALTIEIGRRSIAAGHNMLAPGDYAVMSVTDTGKGMSADVMSHIFEPFFTTKGERGTGLGLATCYGVVQQAGGDIEVESHPGFGSKFTVLLPLVAGMAAGTSAPAPAPMVQASATNVALVVEDQPAIRRSMTRSLQRAGFNVIDARSAEEALSMVEDLKAHVDLLITDIVLPGLDGIKLAQRLRGAQPHIRVLVCSGYSDKAQYSDLEGQPQTAFLPKPFTGADLVARATALFA